MNRLTVWAIRWGIPAQAVAELRQELGWDVESTPNAIGGLSEAAVQSRVRVEASRKGLRLWRNNVGAGYDEAGNFMRWGLANDSSQVNEKLKSSDLIGIRPTVILPEMVGTIIGRFTAREIKCGGWKWTGTPRETAQHNFITLVNALGGDAAFASHEGTL